MKKNFITDNYPIYFFPTTLIRSKQNLSVYTNSKNNHPETGINAGFNIASVYGKNSDFSPRSKNVFTVSLFMVHHQRE